MRKGTKQRDRENDLEIKISAALAIQMYRATLLAGLVALVIFAAVVAVWALI